MKVNVVIVPIKKSKNIKKYIENYN